ncbi:MAG: histidinol-phosphate transaminase [Actinomycetota bacterium]
MSPRPALTVRADLMDLEPYRSPQVAARYRLNTNESPHPPPEKLIETITARLAGIALNRYPDHHASGLFGAIARYADWSDDGLWVANGSNEVLLHLFLAFGGPGRTSVTFEPTYSLHTAIPRIAGTRVRQLWRAEDFSIDLDEAVALIRTQRPEIVMVCSPNNPSGNCESRDTVRALLEEAPGIVVVDEAYIEFTDSSNSMRSLLDDHPNLVLVRTFSKAWRLAGLRIGYLLADPELVAEIARVRLPYHLSSVTQAVGEAAAAFVDHTMEAAEAVAKERERIAVELQAFGLKTYPSRANFVLFQVDDPEFIWRALLERGILVRNYNDVPGLMGCLRVTAGMPDETDAFLSALREVLDD